MKTDQLTVTTFAVVFAAAAFAGGKDADKELSFKLYFAPKTATAPKLDGKLDDPCWKNVEPITDYGPCTLGQSDRNRIPRTEVRLLWDDKYLYVAAKCFEDTPENMASFLHIVNDRKRAFHFRDCIEMHIDGNNDEHTKFQCWLLANKEKYIYWCWDRGWGLLTDSSYGLNADWEMSHSTGMEDGMDYWAVEARYALAHFELQPRPGYIFGLEPARFRYSKTIYDRFDGSVRSKNSGQWLAWGSQGGNHHNPDGYGKVIFVEKMPKNVAEGLKLAYPDLEKRRILVQTGKEYAVFDHGRESTLTYAAKAKELIEGTGRLAARYRAFAAEVSNVVWRANPGDMRNSEKILAAFEAAKTNLAAASAVDIAMIGDLEKKTGSWKVSLDDAYWKLVRNAMMVEGRTRVPVSLKPAADAPALGSEFADCTFKPEERRHGGVPWAKPLAAGRRKVFITVNSQGGIDAWQLAKRMDVDAVIFQSTGGHGAVGVSGDYFNEGLWYVPKKRQELERALKEKGPFDWYVFIGTGIETWPAELQCWLLERMLEGADVFEKNPMRRSLFAASLKTRPEISAGVPLGFTRLVRNPEGGSFDSIVEQVKLASSPLQVAAFGKGAYGRLTTDSTGGYVHCAHGAPAWRTTPENVFQDEYGFAYLARGIMEAFGLRGENRLIDVGDGLREVAADAAATVPLRVAGPADWSAEIGWTVRRTDGAVVAERKKTFSIPAGTNHVSLAVGPLAAGEYYVDARLLSSGGGILDFASGRVVAANRAPFVKCGCSPNCSEILPTPEIKEFKLAAKTLMRAGEPVSATVKVAPAAAGLEVRAEIRDVRNRVIVRKDFPVDAASGIASVSLENAPEYDWSHANLDVTLFSGPRILGKETRAFYRHRGDVSDFMVFTSNPGPGGLNGDIRLSYLQNNGIDLLQRDYSADFLWRGGDAVIRDRIPGGVPDKGGALSNPWWLKHLKTRYGAHARDLKAVNGRWISLGDDSGEPHDFPRNIPDWVPCWVGRQIEKCRQESLRWKARGAKRPVYEATTQWWRDHGNKTRWGDDSFSYWGFEHPVKGEALKFMAATTDPKDIKEIVECFREVYGTVEKFNRAANAKITKWEDVDHDLLASLTFDPSPEYVNFLFWLRERYGGDVAKLNAAWKTEVRDFLEIPRELIDEKQLDGVYAPSIDMQTFLEDAFVNQCKAIADGIHGVDPTIGLGFGASTLGNTFCPASKHLDSVCPYAGSMDIEMMRGQKHRFIGECIGIYGGRNVPAPLRRSQVWHGLLTGCNFGWFWDACFNYGDASVDERRYGAMLETYLEIKRGPASLCLRSKRDNYGIRILVSRDSAHMNPLVAEMGAHHADGFARLVESLGLQYDSITQEQVAKNALAAEGVKILLLPYVQVLNPPEVEKIKEFVAKGGMIVADARCGVYTRAGEPIEKPPMDEVFGITRTQSKAAPALRDLAVTRYTDVPAKLTGARVDTSIRAAAAQAAAQAADGSVAFLVNERFGKGKAVLFNFNLAVLPFLDGRGELGAVRTVLENLMSLGGVRPPAVMRNAKGELITGTEFSRFTRGDAVYLGVEKSGHAFEKFPMQANVHLDRRYWVYDVRAGRAVGHVDRIPMTLTGLDIALYALLPAEVKGVTLDAPDTVARGTPLKAAAELKLADGAKFATTPVFRLELIPEGGYDREDYMPYPWRIRDAKNCRVESEWAIGFDEKPGRKFDLVVTDAATGFSARKTVTVK
ncbi:MAG: beta-galactosidase trimerization domain-containing protein [Kiritimatiellae bacterium]|nr:beta-galactosidase trimerization domain-containing protein [Kiritimatiellia bacterium]